MKRKCLPAAAASSVLLCVHMIIVGMFPPNKGKGQVFLTWGMKRFTCVRELDLYFILQDEVEEIRGHSGRRCWW